MKLQYLRKKYPRFIYENYSYEISGKDLKISFNFRIHPDIKFNPEIIIKNAGENSLRLRLNNLKNLIFHLGLMEIPSYWKATCSPVIEIRAGFLNSEQIKWWKGLIIKGMGQFFFENKMSFQKPKIITSGSGLLRPVFNKSTRGVLVPVGGGKDSAVTLELLKKTKRGVQCFSLNPTDSALRVMKVAGCKKPIIARRKIDGNLLKLNRRGFLNGHTPFSAYLAFLSVLVAAISGKKYIALSNERSSNEGNAKYLGKIINHQWSKSFEFEEMFRRYSKKYLVGNIEYFSFLRPLYEIQIAKLFSKYPKYFSRFLSCNEAYKTASGTKKPFKKWCGRCSKCLFTFAILYPFTKKRNLLKIFNKNLFGDKSLLPTMQQLIGERGFKPFECVGTKKESLIAFYLSWKKCLGQSSTKLLFLLKYFEEKILPKYPNLERESKQILNFWNGHNNLPKEFERLLRNFY